MKKITPLMLVCAILCVIPAFAQKVQNRASEAALTKTTVSSKSTKSRQFKPRSKATLIWGAGSTNGAAIGEFQNAFNASGSWTATSIRDQGGARTPGNALWVRNTTGTSQGAYFGSQAPIASPSRANGVAIFDSDYMDNNGVAGNFGNGSSPSPHKGELVSPAIDLTGYTDSALTLSFHCFWRNFNVSELSAAISVDGGTTYTSQSIISFLPASANQVSRGVVDMVFPSVTTGVTNLTNCRIKFTFDGDYYFVIIDDVSISTAEPFDLTIQKANDNGGTLVDAYETFQIGSNAFSLESEIRPTDLRFGANVKNFGFADLFPADSAKLNMDIQKIVNGVWTSVYQQSTAIDTILKSSNGTPVVDAITNSNWISVGDFRVVYYTTIPGESNISNDTLIQNFSITNDYLSKVYLNSQRQPFYNRGIFPGGTSFNFFEFGSVFASPTGGTESYAMDSVTYIHYAPTNYTGNGTQVVSVIVYEWNDLTADGVIDNFVPSLNSELTAVAVGIDTLRGITAGVYGASTATLVDVNTFQNSFQMADNKKYLVTLKISGNAFTSTNSIWFAASTSRSYAMNNIGATSADPFLTTSQLFLQDGAGQNNAYSIGFGVDLIPSFGVHLSSPPPAVANLVISEIMYNPPESGTDSLEYIEIYNADTATVDLAGYTFNQGVTHTISSGILAPGEFYVIGVDSAAIRNVFGIAADDQWTSGGLSNGGEDIVIYDNFGRLVDSVNYDDASPWPTGFSAGGPDGGGASIELNAPNLNNNIGSNWSASGNGIGVIINGNEVKGSPGFFPITVSITTTNVSCFGGSDGSATATATSGTSPYTYNWSNGATSAIITNLTAGTYTLTVTDNKGVSKVESTTISEPSILTVTVSSTNVSCNGGSDGNATATTIGGTLPYSYIWSDGSTSAIALNLQAGSYTVTVTDANSCTTTNSVTVSEPSTLVASVSSTNVSCNGGSDGSATATASGGTSAYTYLWSNGTTSATAVNLQAGSYTVTVTDANACTASNSVTITEPAAINLTLSTVDASCNGASDGSITTTVSGGTLPYTYSWSGGLAASPNQTNLAAGSYSVTLTDANGCSSTLSATINQPVAIITTITQAGPSLTADQSGASYQWLDCNNSNAAISGATMQTFTATVNGDYAVEITFNNCVDTSACINVTSVGLRNINSNDNSFNLYPNPSKGNFTIEFTNININDDRLRVFDVSGKIVRDFVISGNTIQLDLTDLNSGIYFLEWKGKMRKLIITD